MLTESWLSFYTALGLHKNISPHICSEKEPLAQCLKQGLNHHNARAKEKPPANTADTETLNFKVASAFKTEFKGDAVSQGITMVELLKEGFELSKRKRKK